MKLTVFKTLVSTEKSQVFKQTYLSMRDLSVDTKHSRVRRLSKI